MKILFSGGGTLGPVTPLLAVKEIVSNEHNDASFVWVGTRQGPEEALVSKHNIPFVALTSGKFRRYISFWNIIDVFKIGIGFWQSLFLLLKHKPDICISAGGFVSVPVHFAAWMLSIPTWIHQQDVRVGLANKLMAPIAKQITTVLEQSVAAFPKRKTRWIGNPIRQDILLGSKKEAIQQFNLETSLAVVFVTGGGTGSQRVNQLIVEAVSQLEGHAQIIHLMGKERPQELAKRAAKAVPYYHAYDFFTEEMKHAYAAADMIISRGGFGTLTEIAALGKPAIIIPKPGHQEDNVKFLAENNAIILVDERSTDGLQLAKEIRGLLEDKLRAKELAHNMSALMPLASSDDILTIVDQLNSR